MSTTFPLAVILGVGPLIGLAVARRFAREGFRTVLVGLDGAFLEVQARQLPGSVALVCDLGEAGAVEHLFQRIHQKHGEVRVLVYNASAGARCTASALDPEHLGLDLRVNALAPLEAVRAVLPSMRRAGQGTILFTGGGLALKPQAELASGSVGKAAIRQLALCLAEELKPEGVHVATVTVAGFVQKDGPFHPDLIAEHYWRLHQEPREEWRSEVVLKPGVKEQAAGLS
jgi:NAD(P)-dependent dehydrogenase (short-subunit alcohol dehydrogenase family)